MNPSPFTRNYVLGVTIDHQIRAVDYSITRTIKRSQEEGHSEETTREIFLTIQELLARREALIAEKQSLT